MWIFFNLRLETHVQLIAHRAVATQKTVPVHRPFPTVLMNVVPNKIGPTTWDAIDCTTENDANSRPESRGVE